MSNELDLEAILDRDDLNHVMRGSDQYIHTDEVVKVASLANNQIKQLEAALKVAREGLSFYGNHRNWGHTPFSSDMVAEYKTTILGDCEHYSEAFGRGGKNARETEAKIKEILGEN